ncbi:MAG: hypothetical protein NTV49_01425 [Kiritimatiellaeota bacterium]|nr:hypothetical protein [Kiritimatiellota bacterium]
MQTNMKCITLAGVAALMAIAGFARAEDAKVTGELDLPIHSAYVWRGQVLNTKAVVQPSLTVSQYGFSLNTWANYNINSTYHSYGDGNKQDFSQINLTASYATTVGPASCPIALGGGIIQYEFPNQTQALSTNGLGRAAPGTREVYAALGLPSLPLAPKLQVNYDVDAVNGFYANLGISQSLELLKDKVALTARAALGAGSKKNNEAYYAQSQTSLVDAMLGLALPITLPSGWSLTPAAQYNFLPNSTIRTASNALP